MSEAEWLGLRLGDVADVIMGQAPPGDTVSDDGGGGLPFLQGNAEFGPAHPAARLVCTRPPRRCSKDDILISVRAPVGEINLADKPYAIGRGLAAIRFVAMDAGYGSHALHRAVSQLRRVAQGTTFDAVSRRNLGDILLGAPADRSEQRQISEILDALDEQLVLSTRAISKLDAERIALVEELVTADIASFGEMRLGDAVLRIDAGWSPLCDERPPAYGSWGVLKVSAITSGTFRSIESKGLLPGTNPRPEIEVQDGDLIMCRANGVKQLVGAVAIATNVQPKLMLSDKTLRLVPDHELLLPEYLHLLLSSQAGRRQIDAFLSGSSGQNNISQAFIRSMNIPVPDMGRQQQAVHAIRVLDDRISAEKDLMACQQTMKQGLMDDLLTGRVRVTDGGMERVEAG